MKTSSLHFTKFFYLIWKKKRKTPDYSEHLIPQLIRMDNRVYYISNQNHIKLIRYNFTVNPEVSKRKLFFNIAILTRISFTEF